MGIGELKQKKLFFNIMYLKNLNAGLQLDWNPYLFCWPSLSRFDKGTDVKEGGIQSRIQCDKLRERRESTITVNRAILQKIASFMYL